MINDFFFSQSTFWTTTAIMCVMKRPFFADLEIRNIEFLFFSLTDLEI